jgi:hypothetical protein
MQTRWLTQKALALTMAFALLTWLGVCIPVHFRAVSPMLLERAGRDTPTLRTLCSDHVMAGKVGPVRMLWDAGLTKPSELERSRVVSILADKPAYRASGGPAPYFEAFLALLHSPSDKGADRNVTDIVLPRANREVLLQFLSGSSNYAVQELLKVRELAGWKSFMPVNTPAGHPLDASILTLALLVQSDAFSPELTRALPALVADARAGNRARQDELEDLLLAVLSLSRRMDWTQLAELSACMSSPEELASAARRAVADWDAFPTIYAAALLYGNYEPVEHWLAGHAEQGFVALEQTLPHGRGALDMLFTSDKDPYIPPALVRHLDSALSWARPDAVLDFALHNPRGALYLKNLFFLLSGYTLALALACFLRFCGVQNSANYKLRRPMLALENVLVAAAFTILLWLVVEPNLLRLNVEKPAVAVFDLSTAFSDPSKNTQSMNANPLDQASILSLLLFFIVQSIVYVLCMMRLNRIKAAKASAQVKIKLLENEEFLFDLALYVGLGGTVGSLVLLSMGIVQASLVAAYCSTLFGIIFTAILKIVNIRPFRRAMILESNSTPAPAVEPTAPTSQTPTKGA